MSELVERSCHVGVGAHPAEWEIHDDGSWHATHGPHKESGKAKSVNAAREAALAWVRTLHKAHTGSELPV